jgi:hypothetical protein
MARAARNPLDQLAADAEIPTKFRREFIAKVGAIFDEYEVASRELDGNPLRKASPILRRLAEHAKATHDLVRKAESKTGVSDLSSWGKDIPGRVGDALARLEAGVRQLHAQAIKPGAPTKHAQDYAVIELLELHERCDGVKPITFVRNALDQIGVRVSTRMIHDCRRWLDRCARSYDK